MDKSPTMKSTNCPPNSISSKEERKEEQQQLRDSPSLLLVQVRALSCSATLLLSWVVGFFMFAYWFVGIVEKLESRASGVETAQVEAVSEVEVAKGWSMTQFCDKMIDVLMNEKTQTKEWRKLLVFREEWNKYRESFYNRCRSIMRWKSMMNCFKEIEKSPTDVNAIVARRRKDFTGEFFRHLTLLSEIYESLEDRDAIARLGARCLSAVSAYDNTVENVDTLDAAQAKFDDILNSPSLDVACEKIRSLAKAKDLDSSLILLINSAWAAAKDSTTMKNEVKDIMYKIYKTTKSSLRSIAPKEIKLLKYLLNIVDPEERFSALATAFSPDEHAPKDIEALHTTPKELHKWVKIMLDAYHLNKEDSDIREAKQMADPVVIQRLFILKETIEEEYLSRRTQTEEEKEESNEL
ncbi:hypothetical protein Syun_004374 [Stephania yunnanensis]|uniref:Uncharacterized protein n=1 Tax=Stephania yunnanensis TaxID=152371 RepID=A0AAP0L4F1_9MAGN